MKKYITTLLSVTIFCILATSCGDRKTSLTTEVSNVFSDEKKVSKFGFSCQLKEFLGFKTQSCILDKYLEYKSVG
jgi:hypothetical protein